MLMTIGLSAAPIDEAKALYNSGDYEGALARLEALARKSPRDGNVNYWLGATLVALNRLDKAVAPLEKAKARGVADASLMLAQIAKDEYDPTTAREYYDAYEAQMRKNKREVPENVEEDIRRTIIMENMLSRVEKIAVIDSLVVDADAFFKAYRLSPEAGRLVDGEMVHLPDVEMAFIPQNNSQILYSEPDSLGEFQLISADILDDGSIDHPAALPGEDLNGGGNAEYPFLLSDGLTLYYANDGEESLGGYDIFMTRRDEDGNYLQPQNIGMPYNSPFDDYLLAIDETTGLGWWATDRNRIPGKVTIYVFVPSDTRVNVSEDDPNRIALARLSDIKLTREPGKSYPALPEENQFASNGNSHSAKSQSFSLPIGSTTRIYHSLRDFKSSEARHLMGQAINARAQAANIEEKLAALRESYAKGQGMVADDIIALEKALEQSRTAQRNFTNQAIDAELSR